MTTTNVTTKIGQFNQPGVTAVFDAISATNFYYTSGGSLSVASSTANLQTEIDGLEAATAALQAQVGSLWNNKVPYTGATANVNLAAYSLTAASISSLSITSAGSISGLTLSGGGVRVASLVFGDGTSMTTAPAGTDLGSLWNAKVPYTGATADVNLSSYSISATTLSGRTVGLGQYGIDGPFSIVSSPGQNDTSISMRAGDVDDGPASLHLSGGTNAAADAGGSVTIEPGRGSGGAGLWGTVVIAPGGGDQGGAVGIGMWPAAASLIKLEVDGQVKIHHGVTAAFLSAESACIGSGTVAINDAGVTGLSFSSARLQTSSISAQSFSGRVFDLYNAGAGGSTIRLHADNSSSPGDESKYWEIFALDEYTNPDLFFSVSGANGDRYAAVRFDYDGRVLIGADKEAGSTKLAVSGDVNVTGSLRVLTGSISAKAISAGDSRVATLWFGDGSTMTTAPGAPGAGGVPYTGASANVNLAAYSISSNALCGDILSFGAYAHNEAAAKGTIKTSAGQNNTSLIIEAGYVDDGRADISISAGENAAADTGGNVIIEPGLGAGGIGSVIIARKRGNVGIGMAPGAWKLSVSGDMYLTGGITGQSVSTLAGQISITGDSVFQQDIQRCGFLNQTETTISFDGENTFTLSGSSWSYYHNGIKKTVIGAKTVNLSAGPSATRGFYYIYLDGTNDSLCSSQSSWTLLDDKIPVATIQWDPAAIPNYLFGEERHTCLIDRRTHWYEHTTEGTKLVSAPTLSGYTIDVDLSGAKTFAITQARTADEDIIHDIAALADPAGTALDYTVLYRDSASTWKWKQSKMPFIYGTTGGQTVIEYNNGAGMTEGGTGAGGAQRFLNSYLLLTNLSGQPRHLILPGRGNYTTLASAVAENPLTANYTGFPAAEAIITHQLTWRTATFTGDGRCVLDVAPKTVQATITNIATAASVIHNTLAGLQGGDTDQYYHLTSSEYAGTGTGVFVRETIASELSGAVASNQTQIGSLWNSKVPYSGATADVNLTTYSLTAGSISSGGGITGTTVSASLLLAGNFMVATAAMVQKAAPVITAPLTSTIGDTIVITEVGSDESWKIGNDAGSLLHIGFDKGTKTFYDLITIWPNHDLGYQIALSGTVSAGAVSAQGLTALGAISGNSVKVGTLIFGDDTTMTTAPAGTDLGALWNAKVPYTGATAGVNLATYSLTSASVSTLSLTSRNGLTAERRDIAGYDDQLLLWSRTNAAGSTARMIFAVGRDEEGGPGQIFSPGGAIAAGIDKEAQGFDTASGVLMFFTNFGGAGNQDFASSVTSLTEQMRINHLGNVGIGTKYPLEAKLVVAGSISGSEITGTTLSATTLLAGNFMVSTASLQSAIDSLETTTATKLVPYRDSNLNVIMGDQFGLSGSSITAYAKLGGEDIGVAPGLVTDTVTAVTICADQVGILNYTGISANQVRIWDSGGTLKPALTVSGITNYGIAQFVSHGSSAQAAIGFRSGDDPIANSWVIGKYENGIDPSFFWFNDSATAARITLAGDLETRASISAKGGLSGGNTRVNQLYVLDTVTAGSTSAATLRLTSSAGKLGQVVLGMGDNNVGAWQNAQIKLGYANTDQYSHWISTRHWGAQIVGNQIRFETSDGTQNGAYPANAVWGLSVDGGTISSNTALARAVYINSGSGNYNWDGNIYKAALSVSAHGTGKLAFVCTGGMNLIGNDTGIIINDRLVRPDMSACGFQYYVQSNVARVFSHRDGTDMLQISAGKNSPATNAGSVSAHGNLSANQIRAAGYWGGPTNKGITQTINIDTGGTIYVLTFTNGLLTAYSTV